MLLNELEFNFRARSWVFYNKESKANGLNLLKTPKDVAQLSNQTSLPRKELVIKTIESSKNELRTLKSIEECR